MSDLASRLAAVRASIAAACARAGRDPDDVGVVAVTKRFGADTARQAADAGLLDIGESYAQELSAKRDALADDRLRWHFIGKLQRNKVRQIVGRAELIHAVDSDRLVDEIGHHAVAWGLEQRVLVAVNLGGESQKSGAAPEDVEALLDRIDAAPGVLACGLMTMPPLPDTPEDSRPYYFALRSLRDRLARADRPLEILSMGTSGDLEVAVEEGATLVRVGTGLFGPRPR